MGGHLRPCRGTRRGIHPMTRARGISVRNQTRAVLFSEFLWSGGFDNVDRRTLCIQSVGVESDKGTEQATPGGIDRVTIRLREAGSEARCPALKMIAEKNARSIAADFRMLTLPLFYQRDGLLHGQQIHEFEFGGDMIHSLVPVTQFQAKSLVESAHIGHLESSGQFQLRNSSKLIHFRRSATNRTALVESHIVSTAQTLSRDILEESAENPGLMGKIQVLSLRGSFCPFQVVAGQIGCLRRLDFRQALQGLAEFRQVSLTRLFDRFFIRQAKELCQGSVDSRPIQAESKLDIPLLALTQHRQPPHPP